MLNPDQMGENSVIPIDRRLDEILAGIRPLDSLDVTLREARGCLTAEDVRTTRAWPHFTSCSIAGFAARSEDCREGARLSIIDKAAAGTDSSTAIGPGKTVEVQSGAVLPAVADVVIPLAAVKADDEHIEVLRSVKPGEGVSREGSITAEDTLLIPGHTLIGDRSIGVLASIGLSRVTVVPRPRVVIVTVGNELVPDAEEPVSGRSRDEKGALLAAAAAAAGAVPYRVAPIADVPELVAESLDDQLIRADVIVVGGAVSSPSDTVREVLGRIGDVTYDQASTNLGPFGTGVLGDEGTHIISLPRDPVAAYMLFRLLVDPIIAGMLGRRLPELSTSELGDDVSLSPDQTQIKLASVDDQGKVVPTATGSPTLIDLLESDAMTKLPPGTGTRQSGSAVEVLLFAEGSGPA